MEPYTQLPQTPQKSTSENLEALAEAIQNDDFTVDVDGDTLIIEAVDEISSNVMVLSEN